MGNGAASKRQTRVARECEPGRGESPSARGVQSFLSQIVEMMKRATNYDSLHYAGPMDLVLREGTAFRPADYDAARWGDYEGTPKDCFSDALNLAMQYPDDLTYVEGYAAGFIAVHHAWCVDSDGNVVDATWDAVGGVGDEYLGIPFDLDYVCRTVYEKGSYGVFPETSSALYETPLDPETLVGSLR